MGKPRKEEEQKAQNQKQVEREQQRNKSYMIPDHMKDAVQIQKWVFDRFKMQELVNRSTFLPA